jgi:L-2-hydroxyglutarate oxidase
VQDTQTVVKSHLNQEAKQFDICVVGGGILGVSISFWLSELFDCRIAIIEKEQDLSFHTSSRNTGVLHRPFYLDPEKKGIMARAAEKSYHMWSKFASLNNLPWAPVGTLEVALKDEDLTTLDKYKEWSITNGMGENETEILDFQGVKSLEPEVKCAGAFFSKGDTSVDYRDFTIALANLARKNGVVLLPHSNVKVVEETKSGVVITLERKPAEAKSSIECKLLINAAGGGSVDIAHMMRLGKNYTDLYFRGEYWIVDEPFASKITHNIYSVAKYKEFPFLDPHYIIRANGIREIGPNAVLVFGPHAYNGISTSASQLIKQLFEQPNLPKVRLFVDRQFLSLVWNEWRSSISKKAMCGRVKQFIPSLDHSTLNKRGISGIRSSLIDDHGFIPEAVLLSSDKSFHIMNYNSPGATGAPSYSAYIVSQLGERGFLGGFNKKITNRAKALWDYEGASDLGT